MIYSTNLYTGLLTPTDSVLFTVASGTVCVVRDIEVTAVTGPNNQVGFQAEVSGQTMTIWLSPPLTAYEWAQWKGRVVLPAGGRIHGNSSFAGTQAVVSGYVLT